MTFTLQSAAFQDGGAIPEAYVREGANRSPPLSWRDPPRGSRSFLLIAEDTDAPDGIFRHWAVYDIAADQRELPEGLGTGDGDWEVVLGRQGVNDFGRQGYDGPQPPPGDGRHHYHFRLAALDTPHLDVPRNADAAAVLDAARTHLIDETQIVVTYER
jgi:Raf kinase inhibitor-like YbhB/YbcL family protein